MVLVVQAVLVKLAGLVVAQQVIGAAEAVVAHLMQAQVVLLAQLAQHQVTVVLVAERTVVLAEHQEPITALLAARVQVVVAVTVAPVELFAVQVVTAAMITTTVAVVAAVAAHPVVPVLQVAPGGTYLGGGGGCAGGTSSTNGPGGWSVIKITYTGTDPDQIYVLGTIGTIQIPSTWTANATAECWAGGGAGSAGTRNTGHRSRWRFLWLLEEEHSHCNSR